MLGMRPHKIGRRTGNDRQLLVRCNIRTNHVVHPLDRFVVAGVGHHQGGWRPIVWPNPAKVLPISRIHHPTLRMPCPPGPCQTVDDHVDPRTDSAQDTDPLVRCRGPRDLAQIVARHGPRIGVFEGGRIDHGRQTAQQLAGSAGSTLTLCYRLGTEQLTL